MDAFVYGQGQTYADFFNAIAILVGNDVISSAVRLGLLFGLIASIMIAAFYNRFQEIFRFFILSFFIVGVCVIPKTSVNIYDEVGGGPPFTVDNVPLVVAMVFSVSTTGGRAFTQTTETAFGDPDIAKYSENGMVFGSRLVVELNQMRWIDDIYARNMQNYIVNCVYYELLDGAYTGDDLRNSDNLLEFITTENPPNPARSTPWFAEVGATATSPRRTSEAIQPCSWVANWLQTQATNNIAAAQLALGRRVRPDSVESLIATQIATGVEGAHTLLLDSSETAQNIFIQAMMINSFRDSVDSFNAGAGSELQAYAQARSEIQTRNTNLFSSELAHKWIPYLKVVLELIFYSMFPILLPFMVIPQSGMGIIKNFVSGFFFLQVWGPLFVLLNKFMVTASVSEARASRADAETGALGTDMTLFNMDAISSGQADIASIAGFLMMLIPVIAGALTMGVNRVAQQSESLLSSTRASATDAARDVTMGNFSLGTSSFNTHRHDQNFGNQWSDSTDVNQGMVSYVNPDGSKGQIGRRGNQIYDGRPSMSSYGVEMQLSSELSGSLTERRDESFSRGKSFDQQATASRNQSYQTMASATEQDVQNMGAYFRENFSDQANVSKALETYEQAMDQQRRSMSAGFSEQYSDRKALTGGGNVDIQASKGGKAMGKKGQIGVRGSGGIQGDISNLNTASASANAEASTSLLEQESFREAVNTLTSAASERGGTRDFGQNLSTLNQASDSMARADGFSLSAARSYREADSYTEAAQDAQSGRLTTGVRLDDAFNNFLWNKSIEETGYAPLNFQADMQARFREDPVYAQQTLDEFETRYADFVVGRGNTGDSSDIIFAGPTDSAQLDGARAIGANPTSFDNRQSAADRSIERPFGMPVEEFVWSNETAVGERQVELVQERNQGRQALNNRSSQDLMPDDLGELKTPARSMSDSMRRPIVENITGPIANGVTWIGDQFTGTERNPEDYPSNVWDNARDQQAREDRSEFLRSDDKQLN